MSHFNPDRQAKYGWGVLRLGALLACALLAAPQLHGQSAAASLAYLHSWRWVGHAYLGAIGAVVNVEVLSFGANLAMLAGAALFCAVDAVHWGPATLVYLLKTFCGDQLAGKLDTKEWKLVLGFVGGALLPAVLWLEPGGTALRYARILSLLFAVQLVCEWGDAHWESFTFFRHRYSFELATLAILTLFPLQPHELLVVQVDLVVCWSYRAANFLLCLAASNELSRLVLASCFRLHFWRHGIRMARVTNPAVAVLVMKQSVDKGLGLERVVASPAWAPVLSIESVDGELWREMRADFNDLMRALPPPSKLQAIAQRQLDALSGSGQVIDADAISRLSASVFIEWLFGREWSPEFEVFVEASWQWRKEIAVRGPGSMAVKLAAVRCLTEDLLPGCPALWGLFGERWRSPRYYSLIMQPFLVSPCINLSDIAVAFKRFPGASAEQAVRLMHPFPILERYVEQDVVFDGRVAVPAHTHVVMFTADFCSTSNAPWPIFGAGQRSCAGAQLMLPFLVAMQSSLAGLPQFQPERGHRYSGRNNDGDWSLSETLYFVRTIGSVLVETPALH